MKYKSRYLEIVRFDLSTVILTASKPTEGEFEKPTAGGEIPEDDPLA